MKRKSRSIISIGTNLYQNSVVPYHKCTTAKADLIGFTHNLIAELVQYGINVNVVSGGLLKVTDASAMATAKVFDLITQSTPLKRVTIPEEIAQLVTFFGIRSSI